MPGRFVHLHLHTEYSLLDGAIRIHQLIPRIKELGMAACAITDHGSMYGVIDFYETAIKHGIKPILGCEIYIAPNGMLNKRGKQDSNNSHLILLAKNMQGFRNLMEIVSKGYIDGFYYKPRVDYDYLESKAEGLICMSACLSGDIPSLILSDRYEEAQKLALRLSKMFGKDNFYLELQMHGLPGQSLVNSKLIQLSNETGIPLVATNDAHYLNKDEARAHEVLLCIQTGKKMTDDDRMRFGSDEFYLKSSEEISEVFPKLSEAITNTAVIAGMCNVELEFYKPHLPDFKISGDKNEFLRAEVLKGVVRRYGEPTAEISDRIVTELATISQMGYTDYFLIVWDFIRYAREKDIIVGPGRGSAAGSIVSYCLGITSVDPLKYNLLFERFLNSERVSMPDIDIDFCYRRRQEVIDYVIEKYGKDRVSQIITFGTMAARAVIRDVGRVLDIPYSEVDRIAKLIPFQAGGITIKEALKISSGLAQLYDENPAAKNVIDTAMLFEGMPRHASTHAAGVVISKEPITNYVPLQRNDEIITTQYDMITIEKLGLLKMDFLGLRTLTVIADAIALTGKKIDFDDMGYEDKAIFTLISSGNTEGLFQLESAGMKQFMKELMPESLEDIIAGISLYRPGPMDQIPKYIINKKNPDKITYIHDALKPILGVTYGCMIYQEQVMQIFRELAGYSLASADNVRRAMSKKKHDVMLSEEIHFIAGAKKNGIPEHASRQIFSEMIAFASYAFNKSHAAAYAVVAYQTAWLKQYHPIEFMTATINSFGGNTEKAAYYMNACTTMGIKILPPDINSSDYWFTGEGKDIRFGLGAIKNIGLNAVNAMVQERNASGRYSDFGDFIKRIAEQDVNKRCIECLIKSGALDGMGYNRRTMLLNYENLLGSIQSSKKANIDGQLNLFEGGSRLLPMSYEINEVAEYDIRELLAFEKDVTGVYLSGHPLKQFEAVIATIKHEKISIIKDELSSETGRLKDGADVRVIGAVVSITTKTTKNSQIMAFVTIEDMDSSIELILFPTVLNKYKDIVSADNILIAEGRISAKEDEEPKILADMIMPITAAKKKSVRIIIDKLEYENIKSRLDAFSGYFNGNFPVEVFSPGLNETPFARMTFDYSSFTIEALGSIVGKENMSIG